MTAAIAVAGVTRGYRGRLALDGVTFERPAASITGLVGRNGAGKTTLMRTIAGHEFASSGEVRVLGADPVRDEGVLPRIMLVREDQLIPQFRIRHALRAAAQAYPRWSDELAAELVHDFGLEPNRWVRQLSRGMRSALGVVIGLAARAEVTLFDEPYAGLDPVARRLFYDRLLADYGDHPRTVLVSTHLIDETVGLLDHVLMLDRGRLIMDTSADDLRGAFTSVSGPAAAVDEFVAGRRTWERRRVASLQAVVLAGGLDDRDRSRARELHLTIEPLSLQQAMTHASARAEEEGVAV